MGPWCGGWGSKRPQANSTCPTSHCGGTPVYLWASCLLSAEAGVWGSPVARRDQPLELRKKNTAQVRGATQSVVHGTLRQV